MNALELLEKANLADKLGNYKLADSIYKKVVRIAGGEMGFVDVIIKGLEKAGVSASEELTATTMARVFNSAVDKAIISGEKAELEALLKTLDAETAAKVLESVEAKDITKISVEELTKISEQLLAKANSEEAILKRILNIPPKPNLVDKTKETFKNIAGNIQQKIQAFMKKPNAKKILAGVGIIVAGTAATGYFFTRANGETVSDEESNSIIDAAENGDPYKNMYEDRMKAGQQQRQNEAAQKFVDENKSKYTSQRAFYDAALAAGDKNFANDVIAIVKKDMSLEREPAK
jgi:hypothetical protein